MSIEIGCLPGNFDIRDYAYRDALQKLSQQTGKDFIYAIFNYDKKSAKEVTYQGHSGFYEYEINLKKTFNLEHKELEPLSVLLPLNLRDLEKLSSLAEQDKPYLLKLGEGFTHNEIDKVYWPPVEQQAPGQLCVANAGVALLEYFERVVEGRHINASRLFLHQVACKLLHIPPTSAPSIRAIVKALTRFGALPEEFWPYDLKYLEKEPDAFCYAYARDYRAASYLRLDRPDMDKEALIAQIKLFVYAGFPVICRFSVYDSIEQSKETGEIPVPTFGESSQSDHAVIIMGYHDDKVIFNKNPLGEQDKSRYKERESYDRTFLNDNKEKIGAEGAFRTRNSWGKQWGEDGYGWLPYAYIYRHLAGDFWSIIKFEWTNTERLGLSLDEENNIGVCYPPGKKPCITS
ncbi:MAG: C1 family peptidase [Mastigocoleus sp. MO_167.B18]|nr:C1 family peptidase [Mastigocoleus sp. MO_167.B18]